MIKNIKNKNNKYQSHGYQQWYTPFTNKLRFRGNYKNDKPIGYTESNWNTKIGLVEKIEIEFYIR